MGFEFLAWLSQYTRDASAIGTHAGLNMKGSSMNELNEEIKLTLNLMQTDIDDGAHGELQSHLYSLLEIKRDRLVAETGLQAELERERERRFEGNRIASAEHLDEVECLVAALEKISDLELLITDGSPDFNIRQYHWRMFRQAKRIAESAIAQYRKEPAKGGDA